MLNLPHTLVEIDSKVFESDENECHWYYQDPFLGVEVDDGHGDLDEITISFFFVLPQLTEDDGVLSLLTVARGLPGESSMPKIWDPVELREVLGGIYAHVTYDPAKALFEVGMNAGSDSRTLSGVLLDGARPELVCGRLLELYVEISHRRIFASVHDSFASGDVSLIANSRSTSGLDGPWGASPAGCWWVASGITDARDERGSSWPPGFGLSDLRITLASEAEEAAGSLAYRGALDHLLSDRSEPFAESEMKALLRHAESLMAVAEDLEQIRLRLPIAHASSLPVPAVRRVS